MSVNLALHLCGSVGLNACLSLVGCLVVFDQAVVHPAKDVAFFEVFVVDVIFT